MHWTEKKAQRALANFIIRLKQPNPPTLIPNIHPLCYPYEVDLLEIRKSGFWCEYEIKLSVSDFKADFKKAKWLETKHQKIQRGGGPNYFYFVTPEGLLDVEDIPEYAGLIEVITTRGVRYFDFAKHVKPPNRLHSNKMDQTTIVNAMNKISLRYWSEK